MLESPQGRKAILQREGLIHSLTHSCVHALPKYRPWRSTHLLNQNTDYSSEGPYWDTMQQLFCPSCLKYDCSCAFSQQIRAYRQPAVLGYLLVFFHSQQCTQACHSHSLTWRQDTEVLKGALAHFLQTDFRLTDLNSGLCPVLGTEKLEIKLILMEPESSSPREGVTTAYPAPHHGLPIRALTPGHQITAKGSVQLSFPHPFLFPRITR